MSRHFGTNGELGYQPSACKQRSRTGCRTCRSRRVKCDERRGGCLNCERLNLTCPYATTAGSTQMLAEIRPLRTYRSCQKCRASKTRCSGNRPVCLRCQNRGVSCVYDGKETPGWVGTLAGESKRSPGSLDAEADAVPSLTPSVSTTTETEPSSEPVPATYEEGAYSACASKPDQNDCPKALLWLLSSQLLDKDQKMLLVEQFFTNFHNLRCFGFIHKPSYMQQIDDHSGVAHQEDPLFNMICAIGAKFYVLQCRDTMTLPEDLALRVGNQWALRAKLMLLMDTNNVSIQNTMAVVLLHEHDLRIGNYASAFMLTGLGIRMAQALQINLEKSPTVLDAGSDGQLQWSDREMRRRLMWSIYTMDSWVGSGVDELTVLNEQDIHVQLPCNERNFMLQIPCIVETLRQGEYLPFVSMDERTKGSIDALDLQAQFIRLISLRRKVLRYVKHLDMTPMPWQPESDFSKLSADLLSWHEALPSSLQFTRTSIYMRKESSQLGGLLLLHWTYHQSLCDLNRIGMQELFRTHRPIKFPPGLGDFQRQVQGRCMEHAIGISLIFEEALKHGIEALADTWLPVIAHDATRVITHYLVQLVGASDADINLIKPHAVACIQTNLTALKRMVPMFQLAKPLYMAVSHMLKKEGFILADLAQVYDLNNDSAADEFAVQITHQLPPQVSPDYVLNPLAIYRMARRNIEEQEKHTPNGISSTEASSSDVPRGVDQAGPPQPASVSSDLRQYAQLDSSSILSGSWFEGGLDTTASFGDNFQPPTTFDNSQAHLPMVYNNFSFPLDASFSGFGPSTHVSDFSYGDEQSYLHLPTPMADAPLASTSIPCTFE